MNFKLHLTVVTVLCLNLVMQHVMNAANALPSEALIECGRVYHIDNIVNVSTATASYSNSGCKLICVVGSAILPVDSIHEGRSCPEDSVGICRAGACIGGQDEAIHECGLIHGMDFHNVPNHEGTVFLNDQCSVRCVLGGVQLSPSYRHEGSPCPTNAVGVCRSGLCVVQSTNPGSTVPTKAPVTTLSPETVPTKAPVTTLSRQTVPTKSPVTTLSPETVPTKSPVTTLSPETVPTKAPVTTLSPETVPTKSPVTTLSPETVPTKSPVTTLSPKAVPTKAPTPTPIPPTVIQPSSSPFSPWMIKLLNITLVSTNPPLEADSDIKLHFSSHFEPLKWEIICTFSGDSTKHSTYELFTLTDIPNRLTQTSMLNIELLLPLENSHFRSIYEYHENLYAQFVHFYHSRKLNYGEQEQFVGQFRVISQKSPYEKIMDVALGFTIVFNN